MVGLECYSEMMLERGFAENDDASRMVCLWSDGVVWFMREGKDGGV